MELWRNVRKVGRIHSALNFRAILALGRGRLSLRHPRWVARSWARFGRKRAVGRIQGVLVTVAAATVVVVTTIAMLGVMGRSPALAATVTGIIELDRNWYTIGSTVEITVTDHDENISQPQREDDIVVNTLNAGSFLGNKVLTNKPIVGTPIAVLNDTTTEITTLEVMIVSAALV